MPLVPDWMPFVVEDERRNAYIPMERWGKDHWSVLAYFETLTVDRQGLISNARMRCNARLHRQFAWMTPFSPHTAQGEYPTRLKDGEQANHDDWSCLKDMVAAGLVRAWFRQIDDSLFGNSQARVELTALALALSQQLQAHKAGDGKYATFVPQSEVVR